MGGGFHILLLTGSQISVIFLLCALRGSAVLTVLSAGHLNGAVQGCERDLSLYGCVGGGGGHNEY